MKLVDVFKAFGDSTRLRIINILRQEKLCVCEIEAVLEINQSNASRHLNKLKGAGIIDYEKQAQWVHYFVTPEFISSNKSLMKYFDNQVKLYDRLDKDNARLKKYKNSGISCECIKDNLEVLNL